MSNEKLDLIEEEFEDFEIVDLTDEDGNVMQFYLVDIREFKGKNYAFLLPAEEIEGDDMDAVSIFELSGDDESGILLPVEDEKLLDELYVDFMADYDPETAGYESNDALAPNS
ncbi:MAG: DUF1292 domain-containing protein [Clostridia bacterium]|nr:DUF1292 domain-containing protein [Clostridia bacterium]